jgi:hypothetical protein
MITAASMAAFQSVGKGEAPGQHRRTPEYGENLPVGTLRSVHNARGIRFLNGFFPVSRGLSATRFPV